MPQQAPPPIRPPTEFGRQVEAGRRQREPHAGDSVRGQRLVRGFGGWVDWLGLRRDDMRFDACVGCGVGGEGKGATVERGFVTVGGVPVSLSLSVMFVHEQHIHRSI